MTTIKLFRPESFRGSFDANANTPRSEVFHMGISDDVLSKDDISEFEIPELFFHATNAPQELVDGDGESVQLVRKYWNVASQRDKLYTPSSGDVVEVNGTPYLCKPIGWEKLDGIVELSV